MIRKLIAFLWKDWIEARSYRISFVLRYFGVLMPLAMLIFVDRLFGGLNVPAIDRYGGDYAAFALVGIVITTYSGRALSAFAATLKRAQQSGTLEALFLTRANLTTILFGWSLYPMLEATVNLLLYLAAGFLILDLRLENANFAAAVPILALTVASMAGLGILTASFTLVFKQARARQADRGGLRAAERRDIPGGRASGVAADRRQGAPPDPRHRGDAPGGPTGAFNTGPCVESREPPGVRHHPAAPVAGRLPLRGPPLQDGWEPGPLLISGLSPEGRTIE